MIPGLRSLRSLTRGYYLPPLRGSLTQTNRLELMFTLSFICLGATQQLVGPEREIKSCSDQLIALSQNVIVALGQLKRWRHINHR